MAGLLLVTLEFWLVSVGGKYILGWFRPWKCIVWETADLISRFDFFVLLCDALSFKDHLASFFLFNPVVIHSKELEAILDEEFLNVLKLC